MGIRLHHAVNTADHTGANIVCIYEVQKEGEEQTSLLAVYKPHPEAEHRYSSHLFAGDETPSDREFGINNADGYCLITLLMTIEKRYFGNGTPSYLA